MVAHNWKTNEVKRRGQKNIQKSNTNKNKFIYQQVHKNETLQNITNILI